MRRIFNMAIAAVSCCLLFGCVKDGTSMLGEQHDVAVLMDVGTRAVEENDGTPTDAEAAIHTLRVYAFVGERLAGHYFQDGVQEAPATRFLMDLTLYSVGEQSVDFYIIANEKAMVESGSAPGFTESTTKSVLNSYSFTELNLSNGLPMFCKEESVTLDFTDVDTDNDFTYPGHEGHTVLKKKLIFSLMRPVGKLGVFAAKPEGEAGTLHITGLTMLEQGTRARNYMMPQTEETLKKMSDITGDIELEVVDDEVTAVLAETATLEQRRNSQNYTAVLNAPFYPFENPWGNGGDWNIKGDEGGNILQIDYEFDGDPRSGLVYMPPIERNCYYMVCCLMHNNGKITIEYVVADWDDEQPYELEFNYPSYTPLAPLDVNIESPYPQPEVYCKDPDSDEGSYSFRFTITGPEGQVWTPTLLDATQGDFTVTVYQGGVELSEPYGVSENPFEIRVRALRRENLDKTVHLAIAYVPTWDPFGSSLLQINGSEGNTIWEGSDDEERIVIKQIDVPNN